jgi:hypothetical protein
MEGEEGVQGVGITARNGTMGSSAPIVRAFEPGLNWCSPGQPGLQPTAIPLPCPPPPAAAHAAARAALITADVCLDVVSFDVGTTGDDENALCCSSDVGGL